MQPDDPVTTMEDFSSSVAMMDGSMEADNFRKRPVIHYSESLQLGKRKFHHLDESASLPNFLDAGGLRSTTDDEAGLSLLFAASLLQQGGHLTSTSMASTSTALPSVVDAATAMNSYGTPLEVLQPLPVEMPPFCANERLTKESLEGAVASSKAVDSIEPTVNDGTFLRNCSG
jgi:hypothetical protein